MKVLIVDVSRIARERILAMLSETEGIAVVGQARDVQEAIDLFRGLRPDAVILDIRMPGGSGIDVLRSIKQERPDTRVIMLTNHSLSQYREKCMNAGADFYFDKSTEFLKVPAVLKAIIDAAGKIADRRPAGLAG